MTLREDGGKTLVKNGGGGGGSVTITAPLGSKVIADSVATTTSDGADVNAGATTDAAVTTDVNATLSSKLRGLIKILGDIWDDPANAMRVISNTLLLEATFTSRINTQGQKVMATSTPVVIASDQAPANNVTASGTITAAGQSVEIETKQSGVVGIHLTGIWVANLEAHGTIDGVDWQFVPIVELISGESFSPGLITVTGLFIAPAVGLAKLRVFCSGFTSGTINVSLLAQPGISFPRLISQAFITDASGNQLATGISKPSNSAQAIVIRKTISDLTSSAPTFATVGVASAQALAANVNRKGLILVNTSSNRISLGFGAAAVLDSGVTLYPAGSFNMEEDDFDTAAVNAIASAAGSNLAIQEYS